MRGSPSLIDKSYQSIVSPHVIACAAAGTRLTFRERHYLPYHGGHTLMFREATLYLQDDDEVCRNFARYFKVAKPQ